MAQKHSRKPVADPSPHNKISLPHPEKAKKEFSVTLKLAFLLGLVSFIVYANTLKNGYVLDDASVLKENTIVTKGISAIPEILSTPYRKGYFSSANDTYRPLSLVMFATGYQFFGPNPIPNHLMNILIFAGCVILLFLFFDQLFERKKTPVAFIAALLFALHPIHTEVVANIKSRDELLCFFFGFLSLNIFIKYAQIHKTALLLLAAFCFLLSLLSKETAITFLAVFPLIFFFYRNGHKKQSVLISVCAVAAAIIFLVLRTSVLNAYNANNTTSIDIVDNSLAAANITFESRIATAILILGYYIKLLFVPYPLICDYSYNSIPLVHFGNPGTLISLTIYVLLAFFSLKRLIKNNKDPFAFGILFFLITMSLFSNIPFLIGATMGERFMFFSSAGFCLIIALLIEKFIGGTPETGLGLLKNSKVMGILIPVAVIYSVITFARNNDWSDNYTLFTNDIKKAPEAAKLNQLFGQEILKLAEAEKEDPAKQKQMITEGIAYISKALTIDPDFGEAHSDIGNAYSKIFQYDSAEFHEKRAIEINPLNYNAVNNLAGIYFAKKEYPQAIALCKRSIELNPDFAKAYANMGFCYIRLKRFDSAVIYLKTAAVIEPDYHLINKYIALSYKEIGNPDSARKYEALEQKTNPDFRLN